MPEGFSFISTMRNGNEIIRIGTVQNNETTPELLQMLQIMFDLPLLSEDVVSSVEQEILNRSFEEFRPSFRGASQREIDTTLGKSIMFKPGMKWEKENDDNDSSDNSCSICLESFEKETKRFYVRELPCCKKRFHKRCVDKWFRKSVFNCPCCRHKFNETETTNNDNDNDSNNSEIVEEIEMSFRIVNDSNESIDEHNNELNNTSSESINAV